MSKIAKYICFDTETGGLDPHINNLLTACFIILDKNLNEIDRLNISIKYNNYNITIKALEINKIDLISHHNSSLDIIVSKNILIDFLKKNKNGFNLIPICHNGNFDINFIQNSGLLPKDIYNNYISYNSIDTIVIANFLKMCGKLPERQSVSLTNLSNYFNITKESHLEHTSEYDTEMTIKLLKEFLKLEKNEFESETNNKKRKIN